MKQNRQLKANHNLPKKIKKVTYIDNNNNQQFYICSNYLIHQNDCSTFTCTNCGKEQTECSRCNDQHDFFCSEKCSNDYYDNNINVGQCIYNFIYN